MSTPTKSVTVSPILGQGPRIQAIQAMVTQVADTDATILISGETGTGKELIARSIHCQSSRRNAAFIAVNCGAVAESLLESEMFGHAKGAFTSADTAKIGKFEAAHGGTIFLDELAESSRSLQVLLLRVLQSGEYTPVGTVESRYCDVRVIAATNCDLVPLLESGRFRHDLYYRINIIRLDLPPLRERRDDLPLLIDHFLRSFCEAYGKPGLGLSSKAREILLSHPYLGNVRELENIIRRAVILCRGETIMVEDLPPELVTERHAAVPLPEGYHAAKENALKEFEASYLTDALCKCGGIVSRAARLTGLSERNFHKKLASHHIDFKSFRR